MSPQSILPFNHLDANSFNIALYEMSRGTLNYNSDRIESLLLPPQGFGPEAKTRGGTLGVPACIHTRTKNIC